MTEDVVDESDTFPEQVTKAAVYPLKELLKELELNHGDVDYEVQFVADLYARIIVAVYMGFQPKLLANDAEESAFRLMELSGVEMEEVENDAD